VTIQKRGPVPPVGARRKKRSGHRLPLDCHIGPWLNRQSRQQQRPAHLLNKYIVRNLFCRSIRFGIPIVMLILKERVILEEFEQFGENRGAKGWGDVGALAESFQCLASFIKGSEPSRMVYRPGARWQL